MSGTWVATVGDRGRLVVPQELRERQGWAQGRSLVMIETAGGVIVVTREQAHDLISQQLRGADPVADLLAERRAAAAVEDAAR